MTAVELHSGAASDVGRVRETNEDAYLVAPPVFVVADGMGGHEGGDVASAIVVEEFGELGERTDYDARSGAAVIAERLSASQRRIQEYAAGRRRGRRTRSPGTTVVVALLVEEEGEPAWLLANLGDSRIYKVHDGALDQVSVDHSLVQELLEAGTIREDEVAHHPERHVITRALGGPGHDDADFFLLPVTAAERLLLCTDGVSGLLDDQEISAIVTATPDPGDAATRVVAAALEAGGDDNATAVVVDVVGLVPDHESDSDRQRVSLDAKLGALP
jgi:serine/threonine protein phosphatase PrpC